ncbi:MAG TPA: alpha/beta hydrolase [Burkholderiales bacterium]|nr:alpha/beta hydrolase [Burkholderiales bacterium]
MPTIRNRDAEIYFEEHGQGFPILTFAPAGVKSTIAVWSQPMAPIKPVTDFAGYRVIVMDQRNAGGKSRAPMTAQHGWDSYTSDHIAVLDHLKIDKCHLFGQCIGGTFIANLIKKQPQRVAAAIWAQPIGRVGPMKPRPERFNNWINELKKDRPELTEEMADAIYRSMYEAGFIYCVDREFARNCRTPSLLLAGNDEAHPRAISDELSKLLPNLDGYITEWKEGAPLEAAKARVKAFLAKHTPVAVAITR